MKTWSLVLRLWVASGTIVQAYPGISYKSPTPRPTSTHHISYKSPTPAPTSKHHISYKSPTPAPSSSAKSEKPLGSAAYAAEVSQALAENPGPGTSLDAAQQQANQQESLIAAQGLSLHAAGVSSVSAGATSHVDCADGTWETSVANYNKYQVDKNLRTWWFGGEDSDGITYAPKKADEESALAAGLAKSFEIVGSQFYCTLESDGCQPIQDCNQYNTNLQDVKQIGNAQYLNDVGPPSHWGWFAIHSVANVATFAKAFAGAFTSAGITESFSLLDTAKTFTAGTANPDIITKDILIGFSILLIATFSFIPGVGGEIGAVAAAALSSTSALLANAIQSKTVTLDVKAAVLGQYMSEVFNSTNAAIDTLVVDLMGGSPNQPAGSTPLLLNILSGGGWVTGTELITPGLEVQDMANLLQKDLLQRAINQLWGHTKTWVTFADLNDDAQQSRCQADKNGWQASKTCADGGVYYLYFFKETGDEAGHLTYPHGADQMAGPTWGLDPSWVTHSSAAAYRSQNGGAGGFAYDYTQVPTNLPTLLSVVGRDKSLDGLNGLEGVWNISVCDMGNHSDWNGDYSQKNMVTTNQKYNSNDADNPGFFFPCCCGAGCSQTKDWVQASQMNNFDTIYNSCKVQLSDCDAWPEGVTEIDFGKAGTISRKESGGQCVGLANVPWIEDGFSPGE